MTSIKTTCPYCGVGCGVDATVNDDKLIAVSGDNSHPANEGRLCVKGMALPQTQSAEQRVLYPSVSGQRVSWPEAIQSAAMGLRETLEQYGPDSVAMYLSGQLLTEIITLLTSS